jgi:predicted protein tyrosine phosphatase
VSAGDRCVRVLFICSANRHRSPTAARLFSAVPGLQCYSAGTGAEDAPQGGRQVVQADLARADVVFVMEAQHREQLVRRFGRGHARKIVNLEIEDIYSAGSPELIELLLRRVPQHLSVPVDVRAMRRAFAGVLTSSCW